MSRQNAARRNHALRKVLASLHFPPELKLTVAAILGLLSPKSGYCIAWPSAATLAKRNGKSRRTIQWHLQVIRELGIFRCLRFTPEKAKQYCREKYRITIRLDRCSCQAPTLFEVNPDHPLWNVSHVLPDDIDRSWGEIVRQMKTQRNAKTTSRLSSDPARWPTSQTPEVYGLRAISGEIPVLTGYFGSRVSVGIATGPAPRGVNGSAKHS